MSVRCIKGHFPYSAAQDEIDFSLFKEKIELFPLTFNRQLRPCCADQRDSGRFKHAFFIANQQSFFVNRALTCNSIGEISVLIHRNIAFGKYTGCRLCACETGS
ncbi:MAG: hypothetical protein D3914_00615 [Candidatus Electrothrix sp. LOE2]|nr:hypothetical protein [Candidatus Electrothrix sp. LOE2]